MKNEKQNLVKLTNYRQRGNWDFWALMIYSKLIIIITILNKIGIKQ